MENEPRDPQSGLGGAADLKVTKWEPRPSERAGSKHEQGELDFGPDNTAGYDRWQQEREDWLARLRKECGLPIGRNVRLKLCDLDREFCGRLSIVELPLELSEPHHYLFRVDNFEFTAAEIEFCVRAD